MLSFIRRYVLGSVDPYHRPKSQLTHKHALKSSLQNVVRFSPKGLSRMPFGAMLYFSSSCLWENGAYRNSRRNACAR